MPYKDPVKRQAYNIKYHKEYHIKNNESERQRIREHKKDLRNWINNYKATRKCSQCGSDDIEMLEFFYVMPIFSYQPHKTISRMISDGHGRTQILAALKDFVLLCRGCRYDYKEIYREMGM